MIQSVQKEDDHFLKKWTVITINSKITKIVANFRETMDSGIKAAVIGEGNEEIQVRLPCTLLYVRAFTR
jgi:hypothetical protein